MRSTVPAWRRKVSVALAGWAPRAAPSAGQSGRAAKHRSHSSPDDTVVGGKCSWRPTPEGGGSGGSGTHGPPGIVVVVLGMLLVGVVVTDTDVVDVVGVTDVVD